MPRSCSTCSRPDAASINEMLLDGRSARSVAAQLGIGDDALLRHARHHLPRQLRPEAARARPAGLDPLDELVDALRARALAGSDAASREYRLALQAQAAGRQGAAPSRDLAAEPEWAAFRAVLLRALEPYPEARMAVADALGAL